MTPLARSEWTRSSPGAVVLLALAPVLWVGLIVWFVGRLVGA